MNATRLNNTAPRVARTISLLMFEIVWKPISGRNSAKATSAVTAASRNAAGKDSRDGGARSATRMRSHLLHVRTAEQTLWQENQRDREHRKGRDILVVD